MARYNMGKEVKEISEITGRTEKEIAEELGLEYVKNPYYGTAWYARNRQVEYITKEMLSEAKKAKLRAARNGNAKAFNEPFFTRVGDEWGVVARGVDFITDNYGAVVVKVRKRNGSVSTVEVIGEVDCKSEEIVVWNIK